MSTPPEWPQHFPANCPPEDALDLTGTVWYLVAHDPPKPEDFRSATERNAFVGKPECERASLSCGRTHEYIASLRNAIPRLRTMHVACAESNSNHGKIKATGKPGHHSMWLTAAALRDAPTRFRVVP